MLCFNVLIFEVFHVFAIFIEPIVIDLSLLIKILMGCSDQVCIITKFYEGSIGDKMARLKENRLSLSDVRR